ncbi:MAG: hypothetical protein ACE5GO_02990, partial [Anaerolineales bacterium]
MPILDYRYPTENQTLVITLVVMLGVLLVVTPLTLGTFLLLFILGFGLNYFLVRARIAGLQRSAVRITAQQFQEIKQLLDECRQRVDIPS